MPDEFDDSIDADLLRHAARHANGQEVAARAPAARLMSRLYAGATAPLRARMLAALLQPLGPLGMMAIAAGAFGGFLHRSGRDGLQVGLEDVGRFTSDQIVELTRFVEQVSPDALQQAASLFADNPAGVAAFSVSVAMLLLRALQPEPAAVRTGPERSARLRPGRPGSRDEEPPSSAPPDAP